jgi:hypothetical protein
MKRRGKTGTVAQTRERGGILMGTTSMDSVYKLHFIYIHTRRKVPSTKAKREKKKEAKKIVKFVSCFNGGLFSDWGTK